VSKEAITLHLPKPHTSASLASLDRLSGVLVHWARCAHLSQHDNACVATQKSIQRRCKGYQAQHHPRHNITHKSNSNSLSNWRHYMSAQNQRGLAGIRG
jgi:hypothetical protein